MKATISEHDPRGATLREFHTHHVDLELEVDVVKRRVASVAMLEAGAAVTLLRLDVFHLVIHSVCVALLEEDMIAA